MQSTRERKLLHLAKQHRADGDDDSASRSYKAVYQSIVLDKLKSTLIRISAKKMSKMCHDSASRHLASRHLASHTSEKGAGSAIVGSRHKGYPQLSRKMK